MKKQIIIVILTAVCFMSPAWSQEVTHVETQYLEVLRDVPVMPGLTHLDGSDLVFEKPGGRIAESFFFSEDVNAEEVETFYREALPQLGWEEKSLLTFVREQEQLVLKTGQNDDGTTVEFLLSPYILQP